MRTPNPKPRRFLNAALSAVLALQSLFASVPSVQATPTILSDIIAVSRGVSNSHVLVIKSDGAVLAWGLNSNGQLGDGTVGPRLLPVQVSGLGSGSGVVAVAAGSGHSLALKSDGTVLAWGNNASGQLGDGTTTSQTTPVQVSGLGSGSGVVAVAAGGNSYSLALKSDGTVLAWGFNSNNELGDGTTTQRHTPVQVSGLGSGSGVTAIATGFTHSLVLKSDGTVLAWGNNSGGQIGDGTTTRRSAPVQVSGLGSGSGVTAVAAGSIHSLAIKSDGTVLAWGGNTSGQLGDGTTTNQTTPIQASGLGSGSGVTALIVGSTHSLALKSDGTVLAWGGNGSGQLGDGTTTNRTSQVQVSGLGSGSGVTAVAAGTIHSLALKSDCTVLAWGGNSSGQLGRGTNTSLLSPVPVFGLASVLNVASGSSGSHSVVILSDGSVLAWGNNPSGQIGDGTTASRNVPVQVSGLGSGSGVVAVAVGSNHSLALKSDGTVLAWGSNSSGQLGDGTTTNQTTPIQVSGLGSGSGVVAVAAGSNNFSLALKSDGTVLAWGFNSNNELGDGTTTTRLTPVQVSGLGSGSGVTALAAGGTHSLALKSDGTVLAWGFNGSGQIGDGTTTRRSAPVEVSGLGSGSGVTAVAAGGTHTLALKSDGTVLNWGNNVSGQLGDGTMTNRNVPVQVSGLGSGSGVTAVIGRNGHSFVLKSDGTMRAWGTDVNGQLGDGTDYSVNFIPSNVLVALNNSTTSNSVTASRLKAGASSTFGISFYLPDIQSTRLVVTFPAEFTVTSAAATADSSACMSNFTYDSTHLYANKDNCFGAITLGGATVTNPSTPGTYTIFWVNDDPGFISISITGDDQITVAANVDPSLTFNVGTQATATSCDGTFSGNGGTLALGVLSPSSVTSSDAATVDHVCTRVSVNATGGAAVTVKSLNAGLKSTSASSDIIASATGTLVSGTPGYGLCVGSGVGDTGKDTTTPVSASPLAASPFASTCSTSAHNVGGLTASAQNLWTLSPSSQNAFARIFLKAAISATTPAHNDYTDTLTFVASGTY